MPAIYRDQPPNNALQRRAACAADGSGVLATKVGRAAPHICPASLGIVRLLHFALCALQITFLCNDGLDALD